jgi:O-antigen/teichoic acid export membrane protein
VNLPFLKQYLSGQSTRNKSVLKNVGMGFFAKGISILIGFLQIPITLSILNKTEYGVWITIFSVTGWLSFFDIGLGNGFRNKLTEALAENDIEKARKITSTTYYSLTFIFTCIILLFIVASFFVPWTKVFKSPPELNQQLYFVIVITVIATALNFVFGLIHTVLAANHKTGKSSLFFLIGQLIVLALTFSITFYKGNNTFLLVAVVMSLVPLLLNVGLNFWYFFGTYKNIAPSWIRYEKKFLKELMTLGAMFFVIQIAGVVMYATDNIIITQLYSPDEVVTYSLLYKYYSIVYVVFGIISTPLWTMYVDAYKKGEKKWLLKSVKNLVRLFYLFIAVIVLMILCSKLFFSIWIGPSFNPPLLLNITVGVYVLLFIWGSIWVLPLNASGKIKAQMIVAILQALFNVPIILLMNKLFHNLSSVVIGNIICVLSGSGYIWFYYKKVFKLKDSENIINA